MFECGTLKCHVENIKMNQGLGDPYEIPVPWFLIEHDRGLVVIDGGNAAECADDPVKHWGGISDVYWPTMTAEQACVPALKAAGFDPADVRYILQSHLHLDHTRSARRAGGLPERRGRRDPHRVRVRARAGLVRRRWLHQVRLRQAERAVDAAGGDRGRLRPLRRRDDPLLAHARPRARPPVVRGHAPEQRRHAADGRRRVHDRSLGGRALPGFLASAVDAVRSVRKLHHIARRSDATVVTGHDPEAWPSFKQSPAGVYD